VTALGDHCAQAMQRARLLQVESEARRTAEQLTAMVAALSRSRTPRQVTEAIGEAAASLGASGSVVAVRVQGDGLDLVSTTGDTAPPPALSLAAAHPLAYATRTGKPVWLARRSQLAWRDRSFDASSLAPAVDVAVPMFLDDRTIGAIGMAFPGAPPYFSREQRRAILTLAGQSAQALDRSRLQ
jgi:GAF domain-containing protein